LRKLLFVFLALSFSVGLASAQTKAPKPKKHAAPTAKHAPLKKHAMYELFVKVPFTGLKGVTYFVLFNGEIVIDGARLGLTVADTAFDVLSAHERIPVLDGLYAAVSVGAKDAAWLDVHDEALEQGLFGSHN
jgi:hypothetical protein